MIVFGLLCEGVRDQAVIREILRGYFADRPGEAIIDPVFPPDPPIDGEVGGWTVLKSMLQAGRHIKALQYADYLVVHIDTDVCDHSGFDVPRDPDPDRLRLAVIERLRDWMGAGFTERYGDRVLHAIAIDGIECWLLPLVESKRPKQAKTAGCLAAANHALKKTGAAALKNGPDGPVRPYSDAAKPYRKHKTLMSKGPLNPSLAAFLAELDARAIEIPEDDDDD